MKGRIISPINIRTSEKRWCFPEEETAIVFCCAPDGAHFLRVQVPNLPGSGKDIAEGKGVAGDCKSERSRMWGTY